MPLATLNSEQLQAAKAPLGHNLVIASAGTGKTSTIVGRIAHLLYQRVPPEAILLLTFTNKAAGEMVARLESHFPKEVISKIEAGTFHAVCYRWLKAGDEQISLKQPSELKTLFRSIYEKREFVKLNLEIQPFSAAYLYDLYSLYQNASSVSFENWFLERYPAHHSLIDIYWDIAQEFEAQKEQYGFVSYNDLLIKVMQNASLWGATYQEVLVDEYQDTNTLQSSLIDALNPTSLFCVGDYDQSIYAFNGANIENISSFQSRYKGAAIYTLKTNYRSGASILSLANRVIAHNERIYPKQLEVGYRGADNPPKLLVYRELFEQYHAIAHAIATSHVPYNEVAVIFRNNSSADGIEAALRERGITCKRKGGTSFFDSKEIKALLDLLTLLVNPRDMMAFIHLFEYAKGIGSSVAKELFESLQYCGNGNIIDGTLTPTTDKLPTFSLIHNQQLGLFGGELEMTSAARFKPLGLSQEVLNHPLLKHPKLTDDGALFFEAFFDFVTFAKKNKSPKVMIKHAINSKLFEIVVDVLSTQRARLKNGHVDKEKKEIATSRIMRKGAVLLELANGYKELDRFLNAMILGGSELSQGEGVNLLTVHASKGLEFQEVYVIDLMEGRFPNRKLMSQGGELEEERRLFYVAVTRAKDKLWLSLATLDKIRKIEFEPSIFLYEAGLVDCPPKVEL
ncbi:MAG TPA: ATP-dependent helicase [Epsilonproteobacteria bacterium]|nr:ATP-dependent helicase [Campylobacterota bacterium]